jgi:glycosyltransferase involved in cell wall biosynthesis
VSRVGRAGVAVLVDATDITAEGFEADLSATVRAVEALVVDGVPVSVVLVGPSTGQVPTSRPVVSVPGTGATGGAALARGLAAVQAERVAYVKVGCRPDSAWLAAGLARLEADHGVALIGSVAVADEGAPIPRSPGVAFTGHPLPPAPAPAGGGVSSGRTLLAGPAWVARRAELEAVGSFDQELGQPFAGIDLAWRLWLAGREVLVDPSLTVVVSTSVGTPEPTEDAARQAEFSALAMIYRNYDDVSLAAALPAAMELSRVRLAERGSSSSRGADFTARIPALESGRVERQEERRRPDAEVLHLLGGALEPDSEAPAFVAAHEAVVSGPLSGSLARFTGRRRVVVATADAISARMAGPAIRAWRLASELALDHEVRLVSITVAELTDPAFSVEAVRSDQVDELIDWCDIFVFQGWVMAGRRAFHDSEKVFVADIYDPLHLEQLEQARDDGERIRRRAVRDATAVLNEQLLRGDFFLCASSKQRDLWLGHLASLGRVNPATYDADPSLEQLITAVPFGVSDEPPVRTGPAIKGVIPGIGPDDKVILWGGGVYNWFDPLTLVRAVDRLRVARPNVRLVFMGMRHPNVDIPEMRIAGETRALADELGLTGRHVFFNEGWVPYDERQNYLLDADLAVTTHFHHVETDFSFRTRVLDYFWADLPTVTTNGDALGELIEHRGLGLTVPPEDVDALTAALAALLDDPELAARCRQRVAEIVPELVWAETLKPLVAFCRDPRRAPDLMQELVGDGAAGHPTELTPAPKGLAEDLRLVVRYVREGGVVLLLRKVRDRAVRVLNR